MGSAFKDNFQPRFRVHTSDVISRKDRCGVAQHFLAKCTNGNKVENIEVQLIEQVQEGNYVFGGKLCCREKYWQAQLFTASHGMDSTWDWYSTNRKGYRKKKYLKLLLYIYIVHDISSILVLFEFLPPYSIL